MTIGHSNHSWAEFESLLDRHSIDAVLDVRSSPYSKFSPQFHRDAMDTSLRRSGRGYRFLGRELGARRHEPECYVDRVARYDQIAKLQLFREGINAVLSEAQSRRVALMCSEQDPITCHRMILVCRELGDRAREIVHVLGDGRVETNKEAEDRLLDLLGFPVGDLFQSRDELVEQAYAKQADRIAWVEPEESYAMNQVRYG